VICSIAGQGSYICNGVQLKAYEVGKDLYDSGKVKEDDLVRL